MILDATISIVAAGSHRPRARGGCPMTAIPPHLRKALDDGRARIVDQPTRTAKARPPRATPPAEGLWLCDQCGQVFPSDRTVERHVVAVHHGGRYSIILDARP